MGVTVTSRIPQTAAKMRGKANIAVRKTLFDISAGAKQRSRVDTGAMKASFGVEMTGHTSGRVNAGAEYTIYNEFGTVRMAAQPMLGPSAEEARPGFEAAMSQIV